MTKAKNTEKEFGLEILENLRKIIRAVDLNSKKLAAETNLTAPQILALAMIAQNGPMTLADIAAAIHLSSSTMVGIIDRLEAKGFLVRERSVKDRRQVFINITAEGKKAAKKAPTPLHDVLITKLSNLSGSQQKNIVKTLEQLVDMLLDEPRKPSSAKVSKS